MAANNQPPALVINCFNLSPANTSSNTVPSISANLKVSLSPLRDMSVIITYITEKRDVAGMRDVRITQF